MKLLKILILMFILSMFAFSCKKEKTATISFQLKSTFKTPLGRNYILDASKLKILFSDFRLVTAAGNEIKLKDFFLYKSNQSNFSVQIPEGEFVAFKFCFGIDTFWNNKNPISFSSSHPLSVEEGLYWDMLKYRFAVVEGAIDNSPSKNQTPNTPFSMHLGTDTLYSIIIPNQIPKNGTTLLCQFNLDSLFILDKEPFQITNFSNHSEPSEIQKAIEIKNSFINSFSSKLIP